METERRAAVTNLVLLASLFELRTKTMRSTKDLLLLNTTANDEKGAIAAMHLATSVAARRQSHRRLFLGSAPSARRLLWR